MVRQARGCPCKEKGERVWCRIGPASLQWLIHRELEVTLSYPERPCSWTYPVNDDSIRGHCAGASTPARVKVRHHQCPDVSLHAGTLPALSIPEKAHITIEGTRCRRGGPTRPEAALTASRPGVQ